MGIAVAGRIIRVLRRPLVVGALLIALVAGAAGAPASGPPRLALQAKPPAALKDRKLDSTLARLAAAANVSAAAERLGLDVTDDRIEIEVEARGDAAEAAAVIRAAGGSVTARYRGLLDAVMPARAVDDLAASGAIQRVKRPTRPYPATVTGEGVTSTDADDWVVGGTAGAGVKVAVIDVGFRDWQARQTECEPTDPNKCELPANVTTANFCGSDGFDGPAADNHGTAVAEIVHEMSPGARLYLVCVDTLASLGQAKDYVIGKGVHVVNHSVGWYNTARGDGTGGPTTPDGIVADARAKGILWVNSAGNEAEKHWSGPFVDADSDAWHEFEFFPGVFFEGNGVKVPENQEFCAYLKWDDWPASDQDFDLYFFLPGAASPSAYVARSINAQTGTEPPTEELCYTNPNPTKPGGAPDLYVAIHRFAATEAPRMDLFTTHRFVEPILFGVATAEASLLEPAASPHVLTVSAVCWSDTSLEPFSSRGPTLDPDPTVIKPDVAGPDGVSSATYGQFINCGDTTSAFFGTSAAAPHVAGAAALLKQANPTATPARLQAALEGAAIDTGPTVGKDNQYGSGLLALGPAPPTPPAPPANSGLPSITGAAQHGQTLSATTGAWSGPAVVLYAYQWLRCDQTGGACSDLPGALGQTYVVGSADVDATLRVEVTAINTGGSTAARSDVSPVVTPLPPQANAPPFITGSARVGQTLTASLGGWGGASPIAYALDWQRCDAAAAACTPTGLTGSSYTVAAADAGSRLRVVVTASNRGGSTTAPSDPTAVVAPLAPQNVTAPTISGVTRAGEALRASNGTWNNASTFTYSWWRCMSTTCAYVAGAVSPAFTLRDADVGATFRAVVTAKSDGGSATAFWPPTARVAARRRVQSRLAVSSFRVPRRAVAGRRMTVTMKVARKGGGAVVGRLTCSARVGKRALPLVRRTLRAGVATCAWQVPRWAAGKRLSGSVRVTSNGASVVRRFGLLVRRR